MKTKKEIARSSFIQAAFFAVFERDLVLGQMSQDEHLVGKTLESIADKLSCHELTMLVSLCDGTLKDD